ncbi:MAG: GCN5-related N-acetyltransferase [uncultured bacterium]|nr:MAG: GCN5-related N-acetyltransferase [uncultured bacterium]
MAGSIEIGKVVQITDRKLISDYLSLDRVWSSEALLSLDDHYWRLATWYGYFDGKNIGLALMFKKLSPQPVFLTGEPNCISHIIRQEVKANKVFLESPLSCLGVLKLFYNFSPALVMNKMQLHHFRPSSFPMDPQVRRLTPDDYLPARDLYYRNTENAVFDVDQFNEGIYFGIQIGPNIVSIAGTTVMSIDYRTVTIGNVITDNDFRHKGYATSCLINLCKELLAQSYDCICIKVSRGNNSALNVYRRLGFTKVCEYFEGLGTRI